MLNFLENWISILLNSISPVILFTFNEEIRKQLRDLFRQGSQLFRDKSTTVATRTTSPANAAVLFQYRPPPPPYNFWSNFKIFSSIAFNMHIIMVYMLRAMCEIVKCAECTCKVRNSHIARFHPCNVRNSHIARSMPCKVSNYALCTCNLQISRHSRAMCGNGYTK